MSKKKFMLAKEYKPGYKPRGLPDYNPPIGWKTSEKLDGYRARWDEESRQFISRQNKPTFPAPEWFKKIFPNVALDGELFRGRDGFQKMGAARKKNADDKDWMDIKYYVYDVPDMDIPFSERYKYLESLVPKIDKEWSKYKKTLSNEFKDVTSPIVLTKHYDVKSIENMKKFYKDVLSKGGEGIMFKDPNSMYEDKRSNFMLKYKPDFDAEGVVVGYKEGAKDSKYEGMLGAFLCRPLINKGNYQVIDNDDNKIFAISGMDDNIRKSYKKTHPIGTYITYEYSGFTDKGKPRFASYVRIRVDIAV